MKTYMLLILSRDYEMNVKPYLFTWSFHTTKKALNDSYLYNIESDKINNTSQFIYKWLCFEITKV